MGVGTRLSGGTHRDRTRSSRGSPSANARRVLLVESHDDTRELYSVGLQHEGFAVVPTSTSDEALPHIMSADVIVTGLAIAGSIGGLAFVERVRQSDASARKPIIVVTAHVLSRHREQALAAGADAFLTKPCLPAELAHEIRRAVALRRLRKMRPVATRRLAPRLAEHAS